MLVNIIIIAIVVIIIGVAVFYVYKAKKNGKKCIGCPNSCSCSAKAADKEKFSGCCCGNSSDK